MGNTLRKIQRKCFIIWGDEGMCEYARYHLGVEEAKLGRMDMATKHWVLGTTMGHKGSLDVNVRVGFTRGSLPKLNM